MSGPESTFEAKFVDEVRKLGGVALKLAPTIAGVPDRLVLWPGGVVEFVELKAEGGHTTHLQQIRHDRLRAAGFTVWVIHQGEFETWAAHRSIRSPGPEVKL